MALSIYMPRAVAYGGGGQTMVSPNSYSGNVPVENCFNLGDLTTYLLSRGLTAKEVEEELQYYKLTTEPDGTTWYCGSSVSMYKPKSFDITRGKYTGGKVKVVKGALQYNSDGSAYFVSTPTKITATDSNNKIVDWLEVRSEIQPISGQIVPQQLTFDSLLKDKYVLVGVSVFVIIMFYLFTKK